MSVLKRTHTCGELRKSDVGKTVVLTGWIHSRRDHGGLTFVDVRDRYGLTQVVFSPQLDKALHEQAQGLRSEYVVAVKGVVAERPAGTVNPKIATGEVEINAQELQLLNKAAQAPFSVTDEGVSLDLRLKYRFIDLRREEMQRRLIFRHRICQLARTYFDRHGFVDVETPVLTKSTPEGARDYLVPSRVQEGKFYALPQSPQLFKQILMIAGYDRYFQIVRCFRDEDLRAGRQPEFTQFDLEMAFVDESDVISIIEGLMVETFDKLMSQKVAAPFPRLKYAEAMERYGCDAPDLRFGLTIRDISDLASETTFQVFRDVVAQEGGKVRGLCVPGGGSFTRKQLDELTQFVGQFGAKGLAWFRVEQHVLNSPIAKFFPPAAQQKLRERMDAKPGDLLLFVADQYAATHQPLSELRKRLGKQLGLVKDGEFNLSWVVEFPLLEKDKETGKLVACHHPFTSPRLEDLPILEEKPLAVKARAYDLVLNGVELGGGSIRIHDEETQSRVFRLLDIDEASARAKFGFLLDALRFGAPPHGGIALGLDRMVMLLLGLDNISECIAFPKTQRAACLMTDAPSPVDEQQLKELGLRLR